MARSHTRYIDFRDLKDRGPSATTVIKLMMVCNDMSLANQSLSEWKQNQDGSRRARQAGARVYFNRLQMAHLYEGFEIIEAIKSDVTLMGLVGRCDARTQESFRKLESYLRGGANRRQLERLLGLTRSNLTFHYDETGKRVERAISELARREDPIGTVTRASTAPDWYFQAADRVINSVVCFQIWEIPEGSSDLSEQADAKAMECHELFLRFVDFAGEFIWRYVGRA